MSQSPSHARTSAMLRSSAPAGVAENLDFEMVT